MTNANAPVGRAKILPKHWDDAAGAPMSEVAQSLANLEAANNRLAEIDRIAVAESWTGRNAPAGQVAALASGHTPSPCPGCAAKDEAMEARDSTLKRIAEVARREGPDRENFGAALRIVIRDIAEAAENALSPPADPVADALKAAIRTWNDDPACLPERDYPSKFTAALAELKSRLPIGGAK